MSDRLTRGEEGGAARLLASAHARLAATMADIRLPQRLRLSEWQRTTVGALLARLVRTVEDDLRAAIADPALAGHDALHAALTSAHVAIAAPILERAPAFPTPALASILLRRAEEHRLHKASGAEKTLLLDLIADEDGAIAADAMAVLIAQSARLDPFQEPRFGRTELDAELQHGLVWTIAAALRRYMVAYHRVAGEVADRALATAGGHILASYDEGASLDALCLRLARSLQAGEGLGDALLARSLDEAGLPLFLAGLGARTRLDIPAVWEVLSDPEGDGPVFLLRAAGVARAAAGAILLRLQQGGEDVAASQIDLFDNTSPSAAVDALRLWHADPAYRSSILALDQAA